MKAIGLSVGRAVRGRMRNAQLGTGMISRAQGGRTQVCLARGARRRLVGRGNTRRQPVDSAAGPFPLLLMAPIKQKARMRWAARIRRLLKLWGCGLFLPNAIMMKPSMRKCSGLLVSGHCALGGRARPQARGVERRRMEKWTR